MKNERKTTSEDLLIPFFTNKCLNYGKEMDILDGLKEKDKISKFFELKKAGELMKLSEEALNAGWTNLTSPLLTEEENELWSGLLVKRHGIPSEELNPKEENLLKELYMKAFDGNEEIVRKFL